MPLDARDTTPTVTGTRVSHPGATFTDNELLAARARRNARGQKMTPTRIAEAQELRAAGHSIRQIAAVMGVSRTTVNRYISRPAE